jgi:hypothetical protein
VKTASLAARPLVTGTAATPRVAGTPSLPATALVLGTAASPASALVPIAAPFVAAFRRPAP